MKTEKEERRSLDIACLLRIRLETKEGHRQTPDTFLSSQTVAMLETLHRRGKAGPFLVVAPVSTLGHWQREVESLTDLYCVVYKGDATDRDTIRAHEFASARGRKYRFHVRARRGFAQLQWPSRVSLISCPF